MAADQTSSITSQGQVLTALTLGAGAKEYAILTPLSTSPDYNLELVSTGDWFLSHSADGPWVPVASGVAIPFRVTHSPVSLFAKGAGDLTPTVVDLNAIASVEAGLVSDVAADQAAVAAVQATISTLTTDLDLSRWFGFRVALADVQALGSVLTGGIALGSALPAGVIIEHAIIQVVHAAAGPSLGTASATIGIDGTVSLYLPAFDAKQSPGTVAQADPYAFSLVAARTPKLFLTLTVCHAVDLTACELLVFLRLAPLPAVA